MLEDIFDYEGLEEVETRTDKQLESVKDSDQEGKPIEGIGTLAKEDITELINSEEIKVEQISFTGKYTNEEINKMKETVSGLESDLSNAKQKVHHWQNCYNLNHNSGDLSRLNSANSELSNIASKLSDAKSRLRNAP